MIKAIEKSHFSKTIHLVHQAIDEQVFPGCVFGYWTKKNPDSYFLFSDGKKRIIPSEQNMNIDTLFDLASLTKVFVTVPLVAYFVERGWLGWDTPVKTVLPEFQYEDIKVWHLLSHCSGLIAHRPYYETIQKELGPKLWTVSRAEKTKLMNELLFREKTQASPGEKIEYSDIGFLLLGQMIERISNEPLEELALRYVWAPMAIESFHFREILKDPEHALDERYAATENCPWRKAVMQGQVHDDNTWAMGGIAPHAGVFGEAKDCLKFMKELMSGFFSPQISKQMFTRVNAEKTLGWDTPSEGGSTGRALSSHSVGHLGFTGTSIWADLDREIAVVLLTNRVHPTRQNEKIRQFRPQFHETFIQEIDEVS